MHETTYVKLACLTLIFSMAVACGSGPEEGPGSGPESGVIAIDLEDGRTEAFFSIDDIPAEWAAIWGICLDESCLNVRPVHPPAPQCCAMLKPPRCLMVEGCELIRVDDHAIALPEPTFNPFDRARMRPRHAPMRCPIDALNEVGPNGKMPHDCLGVYQCIAIEPSICSDLPFGECRDMPACHWAWNGDWEPCERTFHDPTTRPPPAGVPGVRHPRCPVGAEDDTMPPHPECPDVLWCPAGRCEPSEPQPPEPPTNVCGGIMGQGCPDDHICDIRQCGADMQGQCVPGELGGFCTEEYAPVCGCDGHTYSNDCVRLTAGVALDHDGECNTPRACEDIRNPDACLARPECAVMPCNMPWLQNLADQAGPFGGRVFDSLGFLGDLLCEFQCITREQVPPRCEGLGPERCERTPNCHLETICPACTEADPPCRRPCLMECRPNEPHHCPYLAQMVPNCPEDTYPKPETDERGCHIGWMCDRDH